jgi:hypothetical protein
MALTKIIATAILLAFAQAAPINDKPLDGTTTGNSASPSVIFTPSNVQADHCGPSSFANQTSDASPLVDDCIHLANNIIGDGTWTSNPLGHRQLAKYGTCVFGVEGGDGTIIIQAYKVGNEDIRDLIFDSINKFQSDGKVGSKGRMDCDAVLGLRIPVEWGLYHT